MRTLPPRAAATVVAPRPSTSTASLGAENSARANYNHSRAVLPPPPSSRPNVQQQVQQRENVQRREQQQNAQNVQRSRRITVQSCLSYCRAPPSPPPAAVTVAKSPTAAAPSAGQPAVYLSPLDIADIQQAWNEVYDVLDRVAEDLSRFEASCASQNNSGNDQPTPKPETPNKATRVVSSAESSGSDSGHGDSVDDRVKCEPAIIIGEDSSVDSCDSGARPAADGLADVGRRRSPPCFVGGANMSVRLKRPASAQSRVRVAATFLDRQHLVDSSSSNSSEAPRILRPKSSTTNVQVKSPPPLATAIVANHSNSKSNHSPPSTSTPIGLPPRPLFAVQKRTLTKLPPLEQTISARSSANCSPTQTLRRRASIRSQLHKASNSAASSPVPTAAAANDQHSPPPQSTPTTRPLTQPAQPRTRSRQRSLERPTATISDQRELQKIRTLLAGLDSGRFRSSSALRSRCASVDNVDRRRPASIAAPRGSSPVSTYRASRKCSNVLDSIERSWQKSSPFDPWFDRMCDERQWSRLRVRQFRLAVLRSRQTELAADADAIASFLLVRETSAMFSLGCSLQPWSLACECLRSGSLRATSAHAPCLPMNVQPSAVGAHVRLEKLTLSN